MIRIAAVPIALADRYFFETLVGVNRAVENYVSYIHFVERLHNEAAATENAHETEVHAH